MSRHYLNNVDRRLRDISINGRQEKEEAKSFEQYTGFYMDFFR